MGTNSQKSDHLAEAVDLVTLCGRISDLNVDPIVQQLVRDPDLVEAVRAVAEAEGDALNKITAVREFVLRQYLLNKWPSPVAVKAPVFARDPSPFDVPDRVLQQYFKKDDEITPKEIYSSVDLPDIDGTDPVNRTYNFMSPGWISHWARTNLRSGGILCHSPNRAVLIYTWRLRVFPERLTEELLLRGVVQLRDGATNTVREMHALPLALAWQPLQHCVLCQAWTDIELFTTTTVREKVLVYLYLRCLEGRERGVY